MAGSDDDLFDDIDDFDFDAEALAAIDAEASRATIALTQHAPAFAPTRVLPRAPPRAPPKGPTPPPKRQRTPAGWAPAGAQRAPTPDDDDDDLPDIIVAGDGSYVTHPPAPRPGPAPAVARAVAARTTATAAPPLARAPVSARPTTSTAALNGHTTSHVPGNDASDPSRTRVATAPAPARPAPAPPAPPAASQRPGISRTLSQVRAALSAMPDAVQGPSGELQIPASQAWPAPAPTPVGRTLSRTLSAVQAAMAAPPPPAAGVSRYAPSPAPVPGPSQARVSRTLSQVQAALASGGGSNTRHSTPIPEPHVPGQGPQDQDPVIAALQQQIAEVRAASRGAHAPRLTLAQLMSARETDRVALREAQDLRYAKEGEASLLRQRISKVCRRAATYRGC
jgi:hypothetical protein